MLKYQVIQKLNYLNKNLIYIIKNLVIQNVNTKK